SQPVICNTCGYKRIRKAIAEVRNATIIEKPSISAQP
ncbi:unnamed protein product, partial [Mesorhabditis spiculigera]